MLRPIDVIFKHPVKKFTVIYQNGKLWQLPRLDFDGGSLAYKRPYTGSREQIFVAQDQSLPADDILLRSQLATLPLPATVVGRNADQFEHWWRQNSFECRELSAQAKLEQEHAKAQLANPNAVLNTVPNAVASPVKNTIPNAVPSVTSTPSISTAPISTPPAVATTLPSTLSSVTPSVVPPTPMPASTPVPTPAVAQPPASSSDDDIFDQLMGDLTNNLR